MKPYSEYSASMRKTIRRLADNKEVGTRFRESQRDIYEALNRDGWCKFISGRYALITNEGINSFWMAASVNQNRDYY